MKDYTPHIGYFNVVDACAETGCPVCRLGKEAVLKYFDFILFESVTDPGIRDQLRGSLGYCQQHAWALSKFGKGNILGVALIYQDVLDIVKHTLPQAHYGDKRHTFFQALYRLLSRPKSRKTHQYRWLSQQRCPACDLRDSAERIALQVLITALTENDARLRDALKTSGGLCFPHVRRGMQLSRNRAVMTFLLALTTERIVDIQEELQEFIRKHDYRFQHENIGVEKKSWKRAIDMIVGTE